MRDFVTSCILWLVARLCLTLCDPVDCSPPGSSVHGDSPGKNTGVGCHALLQGIIPTQGLNSGVPHCRQILYPLSHQGSPTPSLSSFLTKLKLSFCAVFCHSVVSDSATPWTTAHQAPLSMGFSRQEYWSGMPCPPPGDHPNPGMELRSPTL